MTKEQEKNNEIQNKYRAWLIGEGFNPNQPLEIDAEHTISKFLEIAGLKFEPVLDSRDIEELERVTGARKMGRPFTGGKPKNQRSEIRMDEDQKAKLVTLAKKSGCSISEYVTTLVEKEWEKNEKQLRQQGADSRRS